MERFIITGITPCGGVNKRSRRPDPKYDIRNLNYYRAFACWIWGGSVVAASDRYYKKGGERS
jgi:hypothetical protein